MSTRKILTGCGGLVVLGAAIGIAYAQATAGGGRNTTAINPEHRFDIIQSNIATEFTIRLDKVTGETWQRVDRGGRRTWEPIRVFDGQNELASAPKDQINFQILASVLVPLDITLWNTRTGESWALEKEEDRGKLFWRKVDEGRR